MKPARRRPTKQEREADSLHRFLNVSGLLPRSTPDQLPNDPPDFAVVHGGKRIAIEHTFVFTDARRGSVLRAGESNRDWIRDQLEAELFKADLGPMVVSIGFSHSVLTKAARSEILGKLMNILRRSGRSNEEQVNVHWRDYGAHEYGKAWPKGVESITIHRPKDWDGIEVIRGEGGFVAPPQRLLQAAIDDKEPDMPRYKDQYDETWLLMAAENMGPSSFVQSDQESSDQVYRFAFDRAFFHGFGKDWFELRRKS